MVYLNRISQFSREAQTGTPREGRTRTYVNLVVIAILLLPTLSTSASGIPVDNPPVLISNSTSTRAVAVDSVTLVPEPFALTSPFGGSNQRTRVMIFAMNLPSGLDLAAVSADAEDASHRHYALTIEAIRPVPSYETLSAVVLKLNDNLGDVGDVLVSVSYTGLRSNRVRIAIGHIGGGPADDAGAVPTPAPPYTISGQLLGTGGEGLSGIALNLTGPQTATTVTGPGGFYSFGVTNVGLYTLTPVSSSYYTFVPQTFTNPHLSETINFNGTLRSFLISGRLTVAGNPASGIVVPLSGSTSGTATTNSNGEYSFSLLAGGNYTIAPTLTYYDFLPGNLVINDLHADYANGNFNATRQLFTIGGRLVDEGGNGIAGRTVQLTGALQRIALSDSDGNYQFINLPAGYDYTVAPLTNLYYTFTASQTFADLRGNQAATFVGTLIYYRVSGRVQLGPNSAPNLALPISGSVTTTVTTDANGNYSISLPAGGNYTIAPQLTYHLFEPANQIVVDLTSDQINRSFIGTRQVFSIAGKLKDQENNGLPGLTVNLTGAEQRTAVSDAAGNYSFQGLQAGYNYTVTPPSTAAYTFTGQNVNDLRSDQTVDLVGLHRLALSGRIRDQNGAGLIGITLVLSGTESSTTTTAADGSYTLVATATGNYTVTPALPQDFYSFAPENRQFDNLAGPAVTDFTATLTPIPDPAYVLEFDGQPKSVDYGNFWQEGVDLGPFYWEFWAMPGSSAGATYVLSDGYGGAHALLFGVGSFNSSENNRYELLGNLYDGVRFDNYFGSDVGPAIGEWGHIAVGWDGQNIVTYFNGVPVGKTPFAGPRRSPGPGGGGGRLLIGGSDHSNFDGRIAQVRGYENTNPREALPGGVEASFAPETVFGIGGNLLSYYFRSGNGFAADLSHGYNGVSHRGWVRSTLAGILFDCPGCPPPVFVVDPSAPNFATNTAPAPVSVPSPPASPGGALVFDSFSRTNSTYLFGGHGGLGETESGSTGPQAWQTNVPLTSVQPFGILNARAVLLANSRALAWVPSGSASGNVEVRVNRYSGRWGSGKHTGLCFRVLDANNFFFAYTSGTGTSADPRALQVGYYLNGQRVDLTSGGAIPATWTTLTVLSTSSGNLYVYIDSELLFTTTNQVLSSATGAGMYNNSASQGLVNRWDDFTVFPLL